MRVEITFCICACFIVTAIHSREIQHSSTKSSRQSTTKTTAPHTRNGDHHPHHHSHKPKSVPTHRTVRAKEFDLSAFLRGTIPPLTPIWLAKSDPQSDYGCSYEKLVLNGINGFGSGKRILNISERESESDEYIRHLIENIRLQVREMIGSGESQMKDSANNSNESTQARQNMNSDITLYPELILIIDHHLFSHFEHSTEEVVRYISTFWAIVDQIFAEVDSPRVQITITGLIIEVEEKALDFLRISQIGSDRAVITSMLWEVGQHFASKPSTMGTFGNFDAAIVMTGLKLIGKKAVKYFGIAYLGGVCLKNRNAAVVFDDGQFHGIDTAAHELGHLLNMKHDANNKCKDDFRLNLANKSSIMSDKSTQIEILWSKCSVRALQEFSRSKSSHCLLNNPW